MKILVDSCAHGSLTADLVAAGHDVLAVADLWQDDPGDDAILDRAFAEGRIIVTRDKDFGSLAVFHHRPHCGIVRLRKTPSSRQFVVCQAVLVQYGVELSAGAVVTATPYDVRVRLPLTDDDAD